MRSRKILPFLQEDAFYLERGNEALLKGDCLTANRYYRAVYDRDRQSYEACLCMGANYILALRPWKALEVLSVIPANGALTPEFYYTEGKALLQLDFCGEAADLFCRCVDADAYGPYAGEARLDLMDAQEGLQNPGTLKGETLTGIRHISRLIRNGRPARAYEWIRLHRYTPDRYGFDFPDPEFPDELADAVSDVLVCIGEKGVRESRRIDEVLLRRNPGHIPASVRSSFRDLMSGDPESAERMLLDTEEPLSAEERIRLADAWLHLDQPERAEEHLGAVRGEFPFQREAAFLDAYVRIRRGDVREGLEILQMLIRLDPEDAALAFFHDRWRDGDADLPKERIYWLPVVPEEDFRTVNLAYRERFRQRNFRSDLAEHPEEYRAGLALMSGRNYLKLAEEVLSGSVEPLYADLRHQLLKENLSDSEKQEALELMRRHGFSPPYLVSMDGRLLRPAMYEEEP